jgi:hypothetical protein
MGACSADPPFKDETDGVITIKGEPIALNDLERYVTSADLDELCVQSKSEPSDPSSLPSDEPACAVVDHSVDQDVIAQVRENLEEFGLDRLDPSELDDADLYMVAGIVTTDFWDLGKRFCVDNGVIEGCLDPLTDYSVLSPVGSLVLALVDLNESEGDDLKTVWAASIDQRWAAGSALGVTAEGGAGGADSSSTGNLDPWLAGVDQAFVQSPYLKGGE